jgi:hypothetical protein
MARVALLTMSDGRDHHLAAPGDAMFARLSRFGANHIHVVPGARVAELQAARTFLGISFELLGVTAGPPQPPGQARPAGPVGD